MNIKSLTLLSLLAFFILGCETSDQQSNQTQNPPTGFSASDMLPSEHMPDGIYHIMAEGETMWRISRKFNVQLSEILRYNEGLDTRDINVGTRIFIPQPHKSEAAQMQDPGLQEPSIKTPTPIKSDFGYPWPIKGRILREHSTLQPGISIAAAPNTPIKAVRSGKVILSTSHFPGRWIIIDHGSFWSIYGNLGSRKVTKSNRVHQGQVIGTVGKLPLHLEFRRNATPFDPRKILDP